MMRVLIVEDDPALAKVITLMLAAAGHDVEVQASGFGLVNRAAATTGRPDVMVLDHMLPGLSGGAVLELLGRHPRARQVPVLLHSAADPERLRAAAVVHPLCWVVPKGRVSDLVRAVGETQPVREGPPAGPGDAAGEADRTGSR